MTENEISYIIRGAIYKVYNELGPGLLESIYEAALCYQLRKDGLHIASQVPLKVLYDGKTLPIDYRLDILVEDKVIIEIKSVEEMKALMVADGMLGKNPESQTIGDTTLTWLESEKRVTVVGTKNTEREGIIIPEGFGYVEGTRDTGLVIEDKEEIN